MVTIKNSALPNTTHDRVLILSDLEPDDVLAIKMLRNIIQDLPVMLIVGESKFTKVEMGEAILSTYGYTNYVVVQGRLSDKDYPVKALKAYLRFSSSTNKIDTQGIQQFLQPETLIICLKPFYELMTVDADVLSQCVLLLYGSFNIRCMHSKYSNQELAHFLNTAFKHVVLYESFFATGERNSINNQNASEVFTLLNDASFLILLYNWNNYIMTDCLDTIAQLAKNISHLCKYPEWDTIQQKLDQLKNRNLKVVESIVTAKNEQMVLADSGLISFCFNDMPSETKVVSVSFNENRYTVPVDDANAKVYLVSNVEFNDVVAGISAMLNEKSYWDNLPEDNE